MSQEIDEKYLATSFDELTALVDKISFVIVTATDIETKALHSKLNPIPGYKAILKVCYGNQTYYLAKFGAFCAIHVQCEMGSLGIGGSINTVRDAIDAWKPKAIIMVGIAFGIDNKKQKIGDVLVSETVIPYDRKRVSAKEIIPKGIPHPANKILLNRFKYVVNWRHNLPSGNIPDVIVCQLLSGESLIDNKAARDALLSQWQNAQGGEMEGAGVFAAAESKNVPWIIVKGICDFADGNKGQNKEQYQAIAAVAAVSLCLNVFTNEHAFSELQFVKITSPEVEINREYDGHLTELVLFETYRPECETFYLERQEDLDFKETLEITSAWIHGPCGCGKSSIISRYLSQSKKNHIYISLGNYIGGNADEVFAGLYFELNACPDKLVNLRPPTIIKHLSNLLNKQNNSDQCIICIEEIPFDDEVEFALFVQHIFSLIISHKQTHLKSTLKFALSSINSPSTGISPVQKKISEHLRFIPHKTWEDVQIENLMGLINRTLKIQLTNSEIKQVLAASTNSPRFIKTFAKNHLILRKKTNYNINSSIRETLIQLGI
ncbi:MAG: hypothetical protein A2Y07_04225 [Planctomycetes bacterium GWF2_50_10]|nr:MAG: hypothetical protein A2Y07_04225 [Planctomycetes bacterium GWF2_50_10]